MPRTDIPACALGILVVLATTPLLGAPRGLRSEHSLPDRYPYVVEDVLKYCKPAKYINKGSGASPEQFAERLYQVIYQLLTEQ